MKRGLLSFVALCALSLSTARAAQPLTAPALASDIADRYANLIYYGSGATGMALVVIDGNQRVFRSFGETRPGSNVHPQLDSVIRIASLTKLMTSEMLVKLLDQGVVKLNDPLSKYAPPGAHVPTYQGAPITLVNLATHTSALPLSSSWLSISRAETALHFSSSRSASVDLPWSIWAMMLKFRMLLCFVIFGYSSIGRSTQGPH